MSIAPRSRILIVRLSAIGDCILTTPVLNALREKYPDAHIAWAAEKAPAQLLQGHQGLDELIVIPRGWLKSPRTAWQLRNKLRRRRFDITIDPQSLTKSAALAWLSGARTRIGLAKPEGRELAPALNNCRVAASKPHIVERSLELLAPLDIEAPTAQFRLPRYQHAEPILELVLPHVGGAGQFAIINVGAGWPSKMWLPERFSAVARHLAERHGLRSLVIWAGDERSQADEIVSGADGHAVMAPNTKLTELVTLARNAKLFVGCDTGPLHMAAAVGTPCIGLYGPTLPARCGPYGPRHIAVCPPDWDATSSMRRQEGNPAMRQITAQHVCDACDQALAQDHSNSKSLSAA